MVIVSWMEVVSRSNLLNNKANWIDSCPPALALLPICTMKYTDYFMRSLLECPFSTTAFKNMLMEIRM